LKQFLAERMIENPQLIDVRRAVLAIRKRKAMVIDPDPDSKRYRSLEPVSLGEQIRERGVRRFRCRAMPAASPT
jgi:hypothetical protein